MRKILLIIIVVSCYNTMVAQITYKEVCDSLKILESTPKFLKLNNYAEILECQRLQDSIVNDKDDYIRELETELDKLDVLLLLTDGSTKVFEDSVNYNVPDKDIPMCLTANYQCIINIRKIINLLSPIDDIIKSIDSDENMKHVSAEEKKKVIRNRIGTMLENADAVFNIVDEQIEKTTLSPVQKEFYRPGLIERINHYYELIEE